MELALIAVVVVFIIMFSRVRRMVRERDETIEQLSKQLREEKMTGTPTAATFESSLDEKFVQQAKSVVEKHMSDVGFSVEILASEMNISRTHLFRRMKEITGVSPSEFIKNLRLNTASGLIRGQADSISQIAYLVGFNDQSYFSKCFKKRFGMSPTEYAEKFNDTEIG